MDIIIFIIVVVVCVKYMSDKQASVQETIQLIQRQNRLKVRDEIFLEQEHTFYPSQPVSLSQLMAEVDRKYFYQLDIECIDMGNMCKFNIGKRTGGIKFLYNPYVISYLYQEGDNFKYAIKESISCVPARYITQCNFLLTMIEEALKRLDSQVEVRRKVIEYTKR